MTISEEIIKKYNLSTYAKNKHGLSNSILMINFIDAILETNTLKEASIKLGIGEQTIYRIVSKHLTPMFGKLNGGNETWRYKLLSSVEYKYCSSCGCIKKYSKFNIDNYRSDKRFLICKYCRAITNQTLYAARRLRIPSWFYLEKEKIAEFYDNCPEGYQVDHIIPLQGILVSGLHTLNNLQYLLIEENLLKGNKFEID